MQSLYRVKKRLDYLRGEIEGGNVAWGEIAELQALAKYIDPSDTLLLEWAGIPEARLTKEFHRIYLEGGVIDE